MAYEVAEDLRPLTCVTGRDFPWSWKLVDEADDGTQTNEVITDVTDAEVAIRLQVPARTTRPPAISWKQSTGQISLDTAASLISLYVDKAVTAGLTLGAYDLQLNLTRTGSIDEVVLRGTLNVVEGYGG